MAKGKGGNTVAVVWDIAEPIAEELGLSINNIKGAEDAFENNTGKIVDSFRRRAQADYANHPEHLLNRELLIQF